MPLWVPTGTDYQWSLDTTTGRPAAAFGTTVTASATAHTMGSWAQLIVGSSVTEDVYGIAININSSFTSATRADSLLDIGIDEAGGSTYTVKIPYLLAGQANTYILGGLYYYFPLFIKSGSSIGARIQSITGSRTARVWATLYGGPAHPAATRVGTFVQAFGITTAASNGTAITAGTTSEGSWTQIGSATTEDLWWWQFGHGYDAATMAAVAAGWSWDVGVGDATTRRLVMDNVLTITGTTEFIQSYGRAYGCRGHVKAGDIIYARGQCSGTPPTGTNCAVYGLGG
jgi:hypothetical protein